MPSVEGHVAQGDTQVAETAGHVAQVGIQVAEMVVVVKETPVRASLIPHRTRVLIVNDHMGKGT
jgi:hypothetical protein